MLSTQPLRRIEEHPLAPIERGVWPSTIPPVKQLLDEGIDFGPLTIFVGENGAGKSTIVEAIAEAYGLPVVGGTIHSSERGRGTESPLANHLQLVRGVGSREGVFLRSETMHDHFKYLKQIEEEPFARSTGKHNLQSHGESFIEFLDYRSSFNGLWLFDEVESALSFGGQLRLVNHVADQVKRGNQVILSTHSPILASVPGATIYELGEWGIRDREYDDLEMVRNWKLFLDGPARYMRHLLQDQN